MWLLLSSALLVLSPYCCDVARAADDDIADERRFLQRLPDEPERVTLGPFLVRLAPTPRRLGDEELDALYVHIQNTLLDYMSQVTDTGLIVQYFVITNVGISALEDNVSTLRFGEAACAFERVDPDVPSPDSVLIQEWIRQAIDTRLVDELQETDFYYVTRANFVSLTEIGLDNSNNNADGVQQGGTGADVSRDGNGDDTGRAGVVMIASVVIASVAVMLLAALLVKNHRSRWRAGGDGRTEVRSPVSLESNDLSHRTATMPPSIMLDPRRASSSTMRAYEQELASSPALPQHHPTTRSLEYSSSDARSLADSESSWTVATEMGDSAAVHSIATHGGAGAAGGLVATESFERDRQVYLQKDMLTTTWSGYGGRGGGDGRVGGGGGGLSESVLQPSHFSAGHERRSGRRQWIDTDETPRPFVFASHDNDNDMGEEVFLMLPDDPPRPSGSTATKGGSNTAELL